ncbi:heterogeneous nuclear ribonucleoprotein U-like isoform X3 [Mya arenaria]|uniref:heterogeneous nuclear ribonucleoprotein U-like isoform X3 n=1 Tax=Mya arenaria TaxID=6604 RepID=UPI0022E84EF2|nr:heterogeneous nuclear ribonucleoprotein U-like isoform X3 [Mya arenaria]
MSELDPTKLDKLKVAELQEELKSRGLETKGKKAVLISRLKKALRADDSQNDADLNTTNEEGDTSQSLDESSQDATEVESEAEPEAEQELAISPQTKAPQPDVEEAVAVPDEELPTSPLKNSPEKNSPAKKTPEKAPEPEVKEAFAEPEQELPASPLEKSPVKSSPTKKTPEVAPEPEVKKAVDELAEEKPLSEQVPEPTHVAEEVTPEEEPKMEETETAAHAEPEQNPEVDEADKAEAKGDEQPEEMETEQGGAGETAVEAEVKQEPESENAAMEQQEAAQQEKEMNGDKMDEDVKADVKKEKEEHKDRGEKRRRSRSRSPRRESHKSGDRDSRDQARDERRKRFRAKSPVEPETDEWKELTNVILDKFNSDLYLKISKDGLSGKPSTDDGFAMMWAGARGSYGALDGKIAFQVKLMENLEVEQLGEEETNPHVLRVGWSTDDNNLLLGEEELSFGYGGTAKASTNLKFSDYGEKFTAGDVMTAYIDLDSDPCVISFDKNGTDLGTCFEFEKAKLGDKAMFPHILTKNTTFECDFGQKEEAFFPLKEGYVFINSVAPEDRVKGAQQPEKKEDCEMIMMVGLPAAGKTTWADKYNEEHPEAKFIVLGTNSIIEKMKVMGLPRKRNYAGRWDVLIDKATKCLNRMLEIASKRKRNYILDQTNVYASARRRKMQPFEGFSRRAVVVVPTDEDYKTRLESQQKVEGKEVPESAIYEMKANFTVPDVGMLFDEVDFTELQRSDAEDLVEKYREEGQKNLPPPPPQSVPERRSNDGYERRSGSRGRDTRGGGSRWSDRGDDRRGGGGGRWGGSGGGGGGKWGGGGGGGRDGGRFGGGGGGRQGGGGGRYGGGGGGGNDRWGGGGGGGGGGGRWGGGGGGGGRNDRGNDRSRNDKWGGSSSGAGGGAGGGRYDRASSRGSYGNNRKDGGGSGKSWGGSGGDKWGSGGSGGGYKQGSSNQGNMQSYQTSSNYGNQGWGQQGNQQQWGQQGQQAWGQQQPAAQNWGTYTGQQDSILGRLAQLSGTSSTAIGSGPAMVSKHSQLPSREPQPQQQQQQAQPHSHSRR